MSVWPAELEWLAREPVFSVDDAGFTWGDVLVAAELNGAYTELVVSTRRALAWAGASPGPEAIRAAATRFRYERNLLSAEELHAWLSRWHLTLDEWTGYLRRLLSQGEAADDDLADETGLPAAIAVDAICSGLLEREASRLAADAALAAQASTAATDDRRAELANLAENAAAVRRALANATDVEREIGARTLDWTRIETESLELSSPDTAREVALCVRVDGRDLVDLAGDAGVPVSRRVLFLEEAQEEGLHELLGARPGELVGPVARNGSFLLLQVRSRTLPSAGDPELRRRAVSYVVDHAVSRAFETRVRWA